MFDDIDLLLLLDSYVDLLCEPACELCLKILKLAYCCQIDATGCTVLISCLHTCIQA